jgi:site-specific DNA recombinase
VNRSSGKRARCAIYTRKSSEDGLEQDFNSLHAQREACEAYIKSQAHEGWILDATIYEDGGYSGGSMERPGLHQLLTEIRARRIQVIVVYKVDRLTRSLADFARIIEQLDANQACFVSVTQQFNTTSSMGRLTLNVLLSFAQFEREVTGERIRDKLAASKRKGMWMGGFIPLGYQPKDRTLVPVEQEASVVRHIFRRYLELESVDTLASELAAQEIVSKRWITSGGRQRGGKPFSRGAIYHLLRNPLYIGQIRHKEASYPGQHPALIDQDTWSRVQQDLGARARRRAGTDTVEGRAPLSGNLFDSAGNRMTPTYSRKKDGRRYCFYTSQAVLKRRSVEDVQVGRIAATTIEDLIRDAIAAHCSHRDSTKLAWWQCLKRAELGLREINIELLNQPSEMGQDTQHIKVAVNFKKRGNEILIIPAPGSRHDASPRPNRPLIRAIIRAHQWRLQLESGSATSIDAIAKIEKIGATYIGKLLLLAFLAPDLTDQILEGRQPRC